MFWFSSFCYMALGSLVLQELILVFLILDVCDNFIDWNVDSLRRPYSRCCLLWRVYLFLESLKVLNEFFYDLELYLSLLFQRRHVTEVLQGRCVFEWILGDQVFALCCDSLEHVVDGIQYLAMFRRLIESLCSVLFIVKGQLCLLCFIFIKSVLLRSDVIVVTELLDCLSFDVFFHRLRYLLCFIIFLLSLFSQLSV